MDHSFNIALFNAFVNELQKIAGMRTAQAAAKVLLPPKTIRLENAMKNAIGKLPGKGQVPGLVPSGQSVGIRPFGRQLWQT